MNPKPNMLTRLFTETPPFWIKVQVIALIVLAAAGELAKSDVLPVNVYLVITGAASAVAFFAQCAIKDAPIIAQAIEHPGTLIDHLPELIDQVKTIHDLAVKNADTVITINRQNPIPDFTSGGIFPTEAKVITMPARKSDQPPASA